ncbi:GntR family transcriptional regulator [Alteromonas oceanisediminis]|uniref:GntR family transcriptional regulator n=1 Tax=Alteromonas oceanisediminis TaxID=2836180 RepID=UPI001BD9C73E|nr:GntR family transcriptional regulator [Alteromonas oceanisediminis]MBT0587099.1 GntR family transcriptional regulator [Alteromonas oceanisediminis]
MLIEHAVTAADKLFYQLRKDIVEGVVAAGSKLSEAELASQYQVSRAVVREAINRLSTSHLIERKANVGARVVSLTSAGLDELYQVRESLEGMAARLAARHMPVAEIQALEALLDSHLSKVKGEHSYYQEAGDVDFHYRIVVGSQNKQLINLLIDGIYHLVRMYRVQLGMAGPRVTTAFDEHRNIVRAIADRDEELAELLMRRHITYSKHHIQLKLA